MAASIPHVRMAGGRGNRLLSLPSSQELSPPDELVLQYYKKQNLTTTCIKVSVLIKHGAIDLTDILKSLNRTMFYTFSRIFECEQSDIGSNTTESDLSDQRVHKESLDPDSFGR